VLAQHSHPLGDALVGGHERARVAENAEVLARAEVERRGDACRAGPHAVPRPGR
jgi:hypothetical protein